MRSIDIFSKVSNEELMGELAKRMGRRTIFEYSTKELINELSGREGVARTDVATGLQYVEIHVIVRDKIDSGLSQSIIHKFFKPSVILAI